jgi:Ca-activated chloride channel family protein
MIRHRIKSKVWDAGIKNFIYIFILFIIASHVAHADVGSAMRRGNHLYRKGQYEEALLSYQEALVQEPDNPKIHYNLARALYKMEKYDEAIGEFQMGLLEKKKNFQANCFYNIGNCQFKKGQLDAAIESYKTTLLINPKDMDAKQNLEFTLKIKEQMQNQAQGDSTGQKQQEQQQQKQPQPRQGEISKEEAERILQALQSKEKQNLEESKKPERKERVGKDW